MIDMQTLAQGKEAVLDFLENTALTTTNEQPCIYALQRDDAGNLVLFFSGYAFIGAGTISVSGNLLDVADGRVIRASKPS